MTKRILSEWSDRYDILVTFANTGQEHPNTLNFVRKCDEYFGFGTVWIEAVFGGKGVGVRHRVVDFETASRNGEPFRAYIEKHGIPNKGSPQCTSRLKEEAMDSLRKERGFSKALTAIGIRADEVDRVSSRAKERGFVYPLVQWGIRKADVLRECASWPFDLDLPGEHYGNCVWCWKKSYRKLLTLAKHNPEFFDFPKEMDRLYSHHKLTPATTSPQGDRRAFREHRNTEDILRAAQAGGFEEYRDDHDRYFDPLFDWGQGCGESCEIGADQ